MNFLCNVCKWESAFVCFEMLSIMLFLFWLYFFIFFLKRVLRFLFDCVMSFVRMLFFDFVLCINFLILVCLFLMVLRFFKVVCIFDVTEALFFKSVKGWVNVGVLFLMFFLESIFSMFLVFLRCFLSWVLFFVVIFKLIS